MSSEHFDLRSDAASELNGPLSQAVATVRETAVTSDSLARVIHRAILLQERQQIRLQQRWLHYSLVSSAAAALLIALGIWLLSPRDTWAEVVKAIQIKSWIHGVQKQPDGRKTEIWISPARELYGIRFGDGSAFLDDVKTKVRNQYMREPGGKKEFILYRIPLSPGIAANAKQFDLLFRWLMRGDTSDDFSWPGAQVVSRERRTVIEGSKTWVEFAFTLRPRGREETIRCVVRVDPKTNLPVSMKNATVSGHPLGAETVFNYPAEAAGPHDIYDLGVPRTTKVVDRTPSTKLAEIISAVREGQRKFGSYFAIVAHTHRSQSKPWEAAQFDLVWRKGAKFRIETATLLLDKRPEEPPAGTDMIGWWTEKLEKALIIPQRVCDGKTVWIGEAATKMIGRDQHRVRTTWKRFGGVNDSNEFNSWIGCVSTETMPDVMAYGFPPESTESQEVVLSANPSEEPTDCVLAEIRFTREDPNAYHLSRYWYDPHHAYVMRRFEMSDLRPKDKDAAEKDTYDVETIGQCPTGVWYPTRVHRSYGPKPDDGYYLWYFIDFRAKLPDSLFKPNARGETLEQLEQSDTHLQKK